MGKKEKKKSKKKSKNEPKVGEFGSKEIRAVPAIVPKPTKEVFGKDLRDKVKREETPLRDEYDGNLSDASVYDPLSRFKNRDKINPPTSLSSSSRGRSKTPERQKKIKREKSPKRRKRTRSRSRSPIIKEKRVTRSSEKRRDDLKRKVENDNFKVTLSNDKVSSDDILLDIAIDSKSAVKLQEKLAKKKEMMMKRKEKAKDEKRSVAHIVGSGSSQSRKRRSSDSEKKIGLSNELDMVAQRLLDNKDKPRIKTTVHLDSDAESEITLAPSMVLNEGSVLSSKRAKVNFASLAAISRADQIRRDDQDVDSKISKLISSNSDKIELLSTIDPEASVDVTPTQT